MANYKLRINKKAQRDLDNLYIDGFHRWGEKQADLYYDKIIQRFDQLTEQPLLYQTVDHIRITYRRSVCGVHSIFYRVNMETVEVMRILGQQNPNRL